MKFYSVLQSETSDKYIPILQKETSFRISSLLQMRLERDLIEVFRYTIERTHLGFSLYYRDTSLQSSSILQYQILFMPFSILQMLNTLRSSSCYILQRQGPSLQYISRSLAVYQSTNSLKSYYILQSETFSSSSILYSERRLYSCLPLYYRMRFHIGFPLYY